MVSVAVATIGSGRGGDGHREPHQRHHRLIDSRSPICLKSRSGIVEKGGVVRCGNVLPVLAQGLSRSGDAGRGRKRSARIGRPDSCDFSAGGRDLRVRETGRAGSDDDFRIAAQTTLAAVDRCSATVIRPLVL